MAGGQHAAILAQWKVKGVGRWCGVRAGCPGGIIHFSDPDPHLVSNMLNGIRAGQSTTSTSCCTSGRVTWSMGRGIVLDIHKVSSENTMSPRTAYYRGEAWCIVGVWGFHPAPLLPPWWMAPHTIMTEWPRLPSVSWMHASIILPLLAAHTSTAITVKQREVRLIIEDTVPPVPEGPPSEHSTNTRRWRLWSKVNLGHLAGRLDR